jgi:hypothetical protein
MFTYSIRKNINKPDTLNMEQLRLQKLILAELIKIFFILYGVKNFTHILSVLRPIVIPNPDTPLLW